MRELTDTLLGFGFKHSPALSQIRSYNILGSEVQIRDGNTEIRISYFGDEIDDLLERTGIDESFVRTSKVRIYNEQETLILETCKEVRSTPESGMLWSFDLDFIVKRVMIRELFTHWISFE